MYAGVGKSGSPAPNPITGRPAAFSALALVSTAKVADSAMPATRRDTRPEPAGREWDCERFDESGVMRLCFHRHLRPGTPVRLPGADDRRSFASVRLRPTVPRRLAPWWFSPLTGMPTPAPAGRERGHGGRITEGH